MTVREPNRPSAAITSSVRPSLKYSCEGSPLRLTNGRTAMPGRDDVEGMLPAAAACAAGASDRPGSDANHHQPPAPSATMATAATVQTTRACLALGLSPGLAVCARGAVAPRACSTGGAAAALAVGRGVHR